MHNFLVEMCRSCLKRDVPLFETITMDGEANNKNLKNSTVVQNLFRKDIIEEYDWKLCADCTLLLKGAVILEKRLLSSQLVYNNYLRMFDKNNHISSNSSNTFSKLFVQIQDINLDETSEKNDIVRYVEESTAQIIDDPLKTEFQLDVNSCEGDAIETKIKIEIEETNYEETTNDFQYVEETTVNIKIDAENDNRMDFTKENMEVEQLSNTPLLQRSCEDANAGTIMNEDQDYNHDFDETNATNLNSETMILLICSICTQKFTDNQSLMQHLKTHHNGKLYKCDFCAKSFSHQSYYNVHRRIHMGEKKPYKCDLCTKEFSHSSHYNRHIRIHLGEKPYKCDLCDKAFLQKSDRDRHRRIHTGEKPYKCDLCTEAFSQKSTFILHRRIHTGEKPYKCDLCEKSFARKSCYDVHKLNHTGAKSHAYAMNSV